MRSLSGGGCALCNTAPANCSVPSSCGPSSTISARRIAPRSPRVRRFGIVTGRGQSAVKAVTCPVPKQPAPTGNGLTFDPVWLILQRPRPNLDPSRFIAPGKLVVEGQSGVFGPSSATLLFPGVRPSSVRLTLGRIVGVSRKRYGWGLAPRFVAISHEADDGITVTYFSDGCWHGWRPLLTGSNGRMVRTIREYVGLHSP